MNSSLDYLHKPINSIGPYRFSVISTFAGCGGSSLGYKWAGGRVLAAVEWDDNAVQTYRMNHEDTIVFHRDIASLSPDEILTACNINPGQLDVLDGSPPCQGFSTAGKREFTDSRNSLFREYIRLLREIQPKVLIMENVAGLVKAKMKLIFAEILRELKMSGYQVRAWLLNAMYFGVPQRRERIIFIGVRNDLSVIPTSPSATTQPISLRIALQNVVNTPQEIKDSQYSEQVMYHKLLLQMRQGESGDIYHPKRQMFGLRRNRWEKPSGCILRKDGGGASCQCCHPTENRRHTIPEIKRIASFPDAFQTIGSTGEQWARIGNSVPPRFMQAIAEHVYNTILIHHATTDEIHRTS